MNCPFLHIQSHTRAMMIEQIMALIGRGSSNPRQYRRTLESFETATLRRTLDELGMQESTKPDSCLPDFLIDSPALPETADEMHVRNQTQGASTAARDFAVGHHGNHPLEIL